MAVVRTPCSPPGGHGAGAVLAGSACCGRVAWARLIPTLGVVAALCTRAGVGAGARRLGVWLQLDRARGTTPTRRSTACAAVLRLLVLFALVTPFWSLFDQKASTWVLQADAMTKPDVVQPARRCRRSTRRW
jgi:POT family proton-dependent oligopeptide transporter